MMSPFYFFLSKMPLLENQLRILKNFEQSPFRPV